MNENKQIKKRRGNPYFVKGHERIGGRKKGTPNRFTALQNDFLKVYDKLGGWRGLLEWAEKYQNKKLFYFWLTKMLPTNIQISGDRDNPVQIIISDKFLPKDSGNGGNGKNVVIDMKDIVSLDVKEMEKCDNCKHSDGCKDIGVNGTIGCEKWEK